MRIVLLGAPGSGKGTQCKQIVKKYGLLHLSSGDILRQERASDSELGKKAQSYMDSGALVPDDIIIEMMIKAIEQASETGFILDGFPRTVNQAIELDRSLTKAGLKIDIIINLEVDVKVVEKRITGRRSCPVCRAVYHNENMKPKVEGICDNDGAGLIQRPDDTLEVVANRLEAYRQQTEPLVDYYKNNSAFFDINANLDANSVKTVVFEKLDALIKT